MSTNAKRPNKPGPSGLKIRTDLRAGSMFDELQTEVKKIWNRLAPATATPGATVAPPTTAADATTVKKTS